jgi:predicted nucleotide-binding protein (sugar kinase/HSP70/actin superfamily)
MQQAGGLDQDTAGGEKPGLEINKDFVVGLLKAVLVGDAINQMWFKVAPYEVEPGATQRAKDEATAIVRKALEEGTSTWMALRRAKACFDAVECDFTRIKPMVKVTGEFWASITESEGNYHLKHWLMEEGAEVTQEPLTGWVEHLLFSREIESAERRGIVEGEKSGLAALVDPWVREGKLMALRHTLNGVYNLYRAALDFKPNDTVSNRTLADLADPYYNKRMGGGEAYMEVGNLINAAKKKKVHMMASVKPFGCMPSTASDGVQSRVMNDYPQVIFLAVETSGDSEVNFKSRVQMKLFEAKQKAREEAARVIEAEGIDVDAVRRFVADHPQYRRGGYVIDNTHAGTGISFLVEMHRRMSSRRVRFRHVAARALDATMSMARWMDVRAVEKPAR